MNNQSQRTALNCNLDRCLADIFSIGIDVEGMFCLDADAWLLEVADLTDGEVATRVDRGEHAKEFEGIDPADDADIEEAVIDFGARSDLHPAAVDRGVGEGGEKRGLVAEGCPIGVRV